MGTWESPRIAFLRAGGALGSADSRDHRSVVLRLLACCDKPLVVTSSVARVFTDRVHRNLYPGGGADHLRMGRRLAGEVQNGEFVASPGAHYPDLEAPAAFEAAVGGFLGRHGL